MCPNFGIPKNTGNPFETNGKFIIYRCLSTSAHYGICLSCSSEQTSEAQLSTDFLLISNASFMIQISLLRSLFYPFALRMAKTLWSFGHSECNRVKRNFK